MSTASEESEKSKLPDHLDENERTLLRAVDAATLLIRTNAARVVSMRSGIRCVAEQLRARHEPGHMLPVAQVLELLDLLLAGPPTCSCPEEENPDPKKATH
jgi:hypothetical protein